MSVIRVKLNQPFTAVPNYFVNSMDVSADALAAITYLAGKPNNWVVHAGDIRKRFGWGKDKWQRVSGELRKLKLLSSHKAGHGTELIFDLAWGNSVDNQCTREPGFPTVGKPDGRETRPLIKKDCSNKKDLLKKNSRRATNYLNNEQAEPASVDNQRMAPRPSSVPSADRKKIIQDFKQLLKQTRAPK